MFASWLFWREPMSYGVAGDCEDVSDVSVFCDSEDDRLLLPDWRFVK
jgi:hypothetical protein